MKKLKNPVIKKNKLKKKNKNVNNKTSVHRNALSDFKSITSGLSKIRHRNKFTEVDVQNIKNGSLRPILSTFVDNMEDDISNYKIIDGKIFSLYDISGTKKKNMIQFLNSKPKKNEKQIFSRSNFKIIGKNIYEFIDFTEIEKRQIKSKIYNHDLLKYNKRAKNEEDVFSEISYLFDTKKINSKISKHTLNKIDLKKNNKSKRDDLLNNFKNELSSGLKSYESLMTTDKTDLSSDTTNDAIKEIIYRFSKPEPNFTNEDVKNKEIKPLEANLCEPAEIVKFQIESLILFLDHTNIDNTNENNKFEKISGENKIGPYEMYLFTTRNGEKNLTIRYVEYANPKIPLKNPLEIVLNGYLLQTQQITDILYDVLIEHLKNGYLKYSEQLQQV